MDTEFLWLRRRWQCSAADNLAGVITDKYDYDSFGNLISSTGTTATNYLYRGEQYDSDLGIYYLRARYWRKRGRNQMDLIIYVDKLSIPHNLTHLSVRIACDDRKRILPLVSLRILQRSPNASHPENVAAFD